MSENKKSRILYYDILNVLACIAVVFLHHNGLVNNYNASYRGAWTQALIVEVLFYFAVPIFLMLSGATLMEYRKRYTTATFMKKRLARVLIPFIVWSFIALIYTMWTGEYKIDHLGIKSLWNTLINSKMMSIYWFFPVIISIYLAMPVLSLLANRRKLLWYVVGLGLLTYSILPPLCKLLGIDFNTAYQFPLLGGGLVLYPLLGYLLSTTKINRKILIVIIAGSIFSLLLRFVITYVYTIQDGATNPILFNYIYFTAVLPAVGMFLVVKSINWSAFISEIFQKILVTISSLSLGVYLIHMFVMSIELRLTGLSGINTSWRVLMPLVTYSVALLLVWLVRKTPAAKILFP